MLQETTTTQKSNSVVNQSSEVALPNDAKQLEEMLAEIEREEQELKQQAEARRMAKKALKDKAAKLKSEIENKVFTDAKSTIALNLRASNKELLGDSTRYKTIEDKPLTELCVEYLSNPEKVAKFVATYADFKG
jgi:hypothetical protein